jgi:hypothetical protein
MVITMFTIAATCPCPLPMTPAHTPKFHFFKVDFSSRIDLLFVAQVKYSVQVRLDFWMHFVFIPCVPHVLPTSSHLIIRPINISWSVRIMQLLITPSVQTRVSYSALGLYILLFPEIVNVLPLRQQPSFHSEVISVTHEEGEHTTGPTMYFRHVRFITA